MVGTPSVGVMSLAANGTPSSGNLSRSSGGIRSSAAAADMAASSMIATNALQGASARHRARLAATMSEALA